MLSDQIIERFNKKTIQSDKNNEIILSYFGLSEIESPTYDKIGQKYGISRERVRQIIRRFDKKSGLEDMTLLQDIEKIIRSKKIHFYSDIVNELINSKIIKDFFDVRGLFNLLDYFEICINYKIYNFQFNIATKEECLLKQILIIENSVINKYKNFMKKIGTKPGTNGLCKIDEVFLKLSISKEMVSTFQRIMNESEDIIVLEESNQEWYILEKRDNVIINTFEKIVNVTKTIKTDALATIVLGVIKKRSSIFSQPNLELISKYLMRTKKIVNSNGLSIINCEPSNLNKIDIDVIQYFKDNMLTATTSAPLREYLATLNYSKSYIEIAIYKSPILFIDKSSTQYKFIFIGDLSMQEPLRNENINDLENFDDNQPTNSEDLEYSNSIESNKINALVKAMSDPDVRKINDEEDQNLINDLKKTRINFKQGFEYRGKPKEKQMAVDLIHGKIYKRDRQTSLNALAHAKYKCEIDVEHPTFIRKKSDLNYTEPHHIVPMGFSDIFEVSLDVEENIVSLCSNCHNHIHYGKGSEKLLQQLFVERKEQIKKVKILTTFDELKKMYDL